MRFFRFILRCCFGIEQESTVADSFRSNHAVNIATSNGDSHPETPHNKELGAEIKLENHNDGLWANEIIEYPNHYTNRYAKNTKKPPVSR